MISVDMDLGRGLDWGLDEEEVAIWRFKDLAFEKSHGLSHELSQ
jgi:hypothetical protein